MVRARARGRELVDYKGARGGIGAEEACTHGGQRASASSQDRQGGRAETAQQGARCFHQRQVAHMSGAHVGPSGLRCKIGQMDQPGQGRHRRPAARPRPSRWSFAYAGKALFGWARPPMPGPRGVCWAGRAGQSQGSRTGQWPRAGHGASIATLGAQGEAWSTDGQAGRGGQRGQGHQTGPSGHRSHG